MNRPAALQLLQSLSAHDRLLAARFLARHASSDDVDLIDRALRKENVSWVQNALRVALRRGTGQLDSDRSTIAESAEESSSIPDQQVGDIYANALQETTSLLLHEIEPLVGTARLYAQREVPSFEQSKTKKQLDLLDSLLAAISDLRTATKPGKPAEIELWSLVHDVCEQEYQGHNIEVQLAGPSPFAVVADRGRLWLALRNGLRNAIEATETIDGQNRYPIVINWNRTDQDFWVSIIDQGIGLRANLDRIFDIGTSSKREHLGMGLPAARQAMLSIGGSIAVTPREQAGVKFEIRWPRYTTSSV
jgi:signal transduction histidine kinase